MAQGQDPEGRLLPIKIDSTTNGEFLPRPISARARAAKDNAMGFVGDAARRVGLSRRNFLTSACGAAATLFAMNEAYAALGQRGGRFAVPGDAAYDMHLASSVVGGDEFIFDVQGHHVNPQGAWRKKLLNPWQVALRFFPQARCTEERGAIACFSAERFIHEVFLDSDTDLCVLSMVPTGPDDNPLTAEEAAATRAMVEAMEGDHRLMIHGLVHPQIEGSIERMEWQAKELKVAAWKLYTQWGPDGRGYWLDDEQYGIPVIEKAREVGVNVICIHKGLPLPGILFGTRTTQYARPVDVGRVARMYPDMTFIVYHSGYEPDITEGPYDPHEEEPRGINDLIRSLHDNGITPNSNVYAELGSTWRAVMREPDEAAHLMGKLLKYVGEDNVLWGTDSIWYGSPQDQIQAFRTFEISQEFQERYGYPAITPEIRAKVFGLNAAKPYGLAPEEIRKRNSGDKLDRVREGYLQAPDPSFRTYGPRTRREFFDLLKENGVEPT
jgi:predicted TIM-barrel fold metal-dependent hydrolase